MNSSSNPVRVSIPVSVASNIDGLKKAIGSVLDELGCPACCSGFDIALELQREVAFSDLRSAPDFAVSAKRAFSRDPARKVAISPQFGSEIENVFGAIDKLAELSGHTACATGCDIFLQLERQFVISPELKLQEMQAVFR